jgi:hypothetical protein
MVGDQSMHSDREFMQAGHASFPDGRFFFALPSPVVVGKQKTEHNAAG